MLKLIGLIFCVMTLSVANARFHQRRRAEDVDVQRSVKGSGPSLVVGVIALSAAYYPKNKQQEKLIQDIIKQYASKNVQHQLIDPNVVNKLDFQSMPAKIIDSYTGYKNDVDVSQNIATENKNDSSVSSNGIVIDSIIQNENKPVEPNIHSAIDFDINELSDSNTSAFEMDNSIPIGSSYSQEPQELVYFNDKEQNYKNALNQDNVQSQNVDDSSILQDMINMKKQSNVFLSDSNLEERKPNVGFDGRIKEIIQSGIDDPGQQVEIENYVNNINSRQQDEVVEQIFNSPHVNEIFDGENVLGKVYTETSSNNPSQAVYMRPEDRIYNYDVKSYGSEKGHQNYNGRQQFGPAMHLDNENVYSAKIPSKYGRNPCPVLHIIVIGRRSMCRYPEIRYKY